MLQNCLFLKNLQTLVEIKSFPSVLIFKCKNLRARSRTKSPPFRTCEKSPIKVPLASRLNKDMRELWITTASDLSSVCKSWTKTSATLGKNSFISRQRLGKSLMACFRISTSSSSQRSKMASKASLAKWGYLEKKREINWDDNFLVEVSPLTPFKMVLYWSSTWKIKEFHVNFSMSWLC